MTSQTAERQLNHLNHEWNAHFHRTHMNARTQTQWACVRVLQYHPRATPTMARIHSIYQFAQTYKRTLTHTFNNWQNIFVARLIRIWFTITSHVHFPLACLLSAPHVLFLLLLCFIVSQPIIVVIIVIAFIAVSKYTCIHLYSSQPRFFLSLSLARSSNYEAYMTKSPITSFHSHRWRFVVGKSQIQLVLSCELYLFQSIWVSVACRLYTINKS